MLCTVVFIFFFFNDTATTEIYTLSLHDALPISCRVDGRPLPFGGSTTCATTGDRKSTRLNSSHVRISYAVFCLKKKTKTTHPSPSLPRTPPADTAKRSPRTNE